MQHEQIALQMYTIRDEVQRDIHAALRKVAAMGYQAVELVLGEHDDQAVRATLDACGLQVCAAHVNAQALQQPHAVAKRLSTLGASYAVLPWIGPEQRGDAEALGTFAKWLNQLGAVLREHDLLFAYHNHDFEFAQLAGRTVWEHLLEQTDPALVGFELDIYWASVAGHDPLALLERYAGRIPLVHVKDRAAGEPPRDVPFGSGVLDWARLLPAAEAASVQWFIAEQDHPAEPLADAERSLRGLEQWLAR